MFLYFILYQEEGMWLPDGWFVRRLLETQTRSMKGSSIELYEGLPPCFSPNGDDTD
jgi:hypothetical protein